MKLQVFDGGLATRLDPQLINQNQGRVYENIDNAVGVLAPIKDKILEQSIPTPYPFYFNAISQWITDPADVDFLESNRNVYITGGAKPEFYDDTVTKYDLGIPAPTTAPTTEVGGATDERLTIQMPTTVRAINESGGDLPSGKLKYRIFGYSKAFPTPFAYINLSTALEIEVDTEGDLPSGSFIPNEENIAPIKDVEFSQDQFFPAQDSFQVTLAGVSRPFVIPRLGATRQVRFNAFDDFTVTTGFKGYVVFRYHKNKWRWVGDNDANSLTDIVDDVYDLGGDGVNTLDLFASVISKFLGTYQYVYTYYDSTRGIESAPSPISAELPVSGAKEIDLTALVLSTDTKVDSMRIYRVGSNIAEFTLVEQIAPATSYVDALSDTAVDGRLLTSDNYFPPPTNLTQLTKAYGMLFGANGNLLQFTPIGLPNAWPPEFSIPIENDITGIAAVVNGLLVMTADQTFLVTGTGPNTLALQTLRNEQGCISFRSIQPVDQGAVVWASQDGLCMSNGGEPKLITQNSLGQLSLLPTYAVTVDEVYYLLEESGSILAFDYRFNPLFKRLSLAVDIIRKGPGELFGTVGTDLYKMFGATTDLTLKYKSPRLSDGSLTEAKTYKKVYIRREGVIILNIIIDDQVVSTHSYTDSASTTEDPQMPQDMQRGYYIQFEVEGTGKLLELEYKAGDRKDG